MKSKLLSIAIAEALLGLAAGAASAATLTVTTTASGTNAGDGACSLAEAIDNVNADAATHADCTAGSGSDTIELPAGQTITLTGALPTVSSDVTINGNNATIQRDTSVACQIGDGVASGEFRLLYAFDPGPDSPTVSLNNMTLADGCADDTAGGAIRLGDGALTLDGVNIAGNTANVGGGIDVVTGVLRVLNSTLSGNSALVNGGGLNVTGGGTITISNSNIQSNTAAQEGGGLWNSATGSMSITDSTVNGNTAEIGNAASDAQGGGGVFNNGGTVTISNTSIASNVVSGSSAGADDGGGGIFNDGRYTAGARINLAGTTTISNNTVLSTSLNGSGGLNIGTAGNGAEIRASANVSISANTAARAGGGLESNNATLTLMGTTLSGNSAGVNGGGVHLTGADSAVISGASITNNTAGQEGGGLWNSATGNMTISSTTISSNTATPINSSDAQGGGGVFNNGGTVSLQGSQVTANLVIGEMDPTDGGGGVFNDGRYTSGAQFTITDSYISNNTVTDTTIGTSGGRGGGALNISSSSVASAGSMIISGGSITGNTAPQAGGGVETNDGILTLTGVTVSGNSAGVNGGGVHVAAADETTISGSTISANTAGQEGGGLWNSATGNMTISGTTISSNTATPISSADAQGGGGVFNNGGTVSLQGSQVTANLVIGEMRTTDGGGGIFNDGRYTSGARFTITDSYISDNTVTDTTIGTIGGRGGGVHNISSDSVALAGSMIISGGSITGNTAPEAGGGVESSAGVLTLIGVTVSNNSVAVNGGGLHVGAADVTTISDSTFSANTAGQEGGGLWNSATGQMAVTDSTVSGNTALIGDAAVDAQGGGGAFNNGGTVTFHNTSISSNVVSGLTAGVDDGGGGIFNDGRNMAGALIQLTGTTTISDNTVLSPSLNGGGGLNVGVGNGAEIAATSGVQITGNTAARAGGGLESNNGILTLTGITISGNSAGVNGGGVHVTAADLTTISDSVIGTNTAGQEGGGLWNSATGEMSVTNSTIASNLALAGNYSDAQGGGGAFNNGGTLTLQSSQIIGNRVQGILGSTDGGAGVFNDGRNTDGATVNITDTDFIGNATLNFGTVLAGRGGGILSVADNGNAASLTITAGTISGNSAAQAGGGIELRVLDTDTLGLASSGLNLDGVTLNGNITDNNGGGLHLGGAMGSLPVDIQDTNFIANEADSEGGGIWVENNLKATVTVTGSLLDGNNAPNGGGAFMDGTSGTLSFDRSTIVRNVATNGGGINTEGGTLSLSNSTVSSNSASVGGGVNVVAGTVMALDFSTVAGNVASNTGGGLSLGGGGSIELLSTIVADNAAPGGPDVAGTVSNARYSLISNTSGLTIVTSMSNLLNIDAQLGGLADNGGATLTHELLAGSPALDSAENGICPSTDQRGRLRDDLACDIGAFETVAEQAGPNFVVNALGDAGDGSCRVAPEPCTLRDAVAAANLESDASTITFDETVFATPQVITLTNGELQVATDTTIDGGSSDVTVDADGASRVFTIDDGLTGNRDVSLSGLALIGGSTTGNGGGILSYESLSLSDVFLVFNTATVGGGLFAAPGAGGAVTLDNITLLGNSALGSGGGLALDIDNATVTLSGTDISANVAAGSGGGARVVGGDGAIVTIGGSLISTNASSLHGGGLAVYLEGDAALTLADSSISGNDATASGGGMLIERLTGTNSLIIDGVTIAGNTADFGAEENGSGGGIWVSDQFDPAGGSVTLMGSVIAGNLDSDGEDANDLGRGSSYSQFQASNSLVGDNGGSGLTEAPLGSPDANGNLVGDPAGAGVIDPLIGALALNGGSTRNHLPLPGSPLVDHFDGCSGTDQRGSTRGLDADGLASGDCDIGAIEVLNTPVAAVADPVVTDQDSSASGNLLDNDIDPADEDAGTLTITAVDGQAANVGAAISPAEGGQLSIAADGAFDFDPLSDFVALGATESAMVLAEYTVFDGFASDTGSLVVTVDGINDPPMAAPVSAFTTEDLGVNGAFAGTDPDATDLLSYAISTQPAEGSVVNNNDGSFTFDPGTAFQDLDDSESRGTSFAFTVSDGLASSAPATVTVTVTGENDAPTPQADSYTASINLDLSVGAANGVLANDADIDGDSLSVVPDVFTDGVTGGSLDLAADGSFTFWPAGIAGTAVFNYTVSDGDAQATGTVSLDVSDADPVDLAITKADDLLDIEGGELTTYRINVSNAGPGHAIGARVLDILPAELFSAIWNCTPSGGASCTANGLGNIDQLVSIPAGGAVLFELSAIISPAIGPNFVLTNTASVTPPDGVPDLNLANNQASDVNLTDLVFADGFETPPPVVSAMFEARQARVEKSALVTALPGSGAPTLVLHGASRDDVTGKMVQVFARRRAGIVELLVMRFEDEIQVIGEWTPMEGDDIEVRW